MNYQETLTYLYNSAPLFQQVGSAAYKEGLKKKIVKANEELKEVKFEYKTN